MHLKNKSKDRDYTYEKLSKELKRILTGLAYQDADEFLSMRDKMNTLGHGSVTDKKPLQASRKVAKSSVNKTIALLSDGTGIGAPLDYAIDAGLRQEARIDLLVHGAVDIEQISALEKRVAQTGLECKRIQLSVNVIDSIVEYICNHPSLIFVVAVSDDHVAKTLIEEVIPQRGGRVSVPLVLIEDKAAPRNLNRSAA